MGFWQIILGLLAILIIRLAFLFAGGIMTDWKKPGPPK
jgi:hypothetical protein